MARGHPRGAAAAQRLPAITCCAQVKSLAMTQCVLLPLRKPNKEAKRWQHEKPGKRVLSGCVSRVTESREMRDWKGICYPRRRRPVGKHACLPGGRFFPCLWNHQRLPGRQGWPSEGSANALKLSAGFGVSVPVSGGTSRRVCAPSKCGIALESWQLPLWVPWISPE